MLVGGGNGWEMAGRWPRSFLFIFRFINFSHLSPRENRNADISHILSSHNPFTPTIFPFVPNPLNSSHSPYPTPPHTYNVTPAPSPLPSNHTLSPHLPTLTPTSAHASSTNLPPNASFTAPWPTPSRLHSTGNRGVMLAPGGTSNGRS